MSSKSVKYPRYSYIRHPLLGEPYAVTSCITQEMFDDAVSYQAAPEDIFICTYPKCGTTWIRNAIVAMTREGRPLGADDFVMDEIFSLEFENKNDLLNSKQGQKFISSHLYEELLPWHEEAKYICIARNPKDCFTSFYYHTVGFENLYGYEDGKFEDYFELAITGGVDFGDYFKHVPGWWEKSKIKTNVLFILYEDMKDDMRRELFKIVDFIGSEWSEKVKANDNALLNQMVEECSFDEMKKSKNLFKSNEGILYRPAHAPFMRKGIIGDWKNIFTDDQSRRVDERMKDAGMKHPGFDHLWDKYSEYLK